MPFLLAAPRLAAGLASIGPEARRRARLLEAWARLDGLERRAWAGALGARELQRLQRLRVRCAALLAGEGG